MLLRFAALAALSISFVFAQSDPPVSEAPAEPAVSKLRPNESDPLVVRARERSAQVAKLVSAGALPLMRLKKAQEDVQDALDLSMLKQNLYTTDLSPEDADLMVFVAQRMVVRRQRALLEMQELVGAGVISRSEADNSTADFDRAQTELEWAQSRAALVQQLAENTRIQKGIASLELQLEVQAQSHPDWAGNVYTHYEGNGIFTPADLQRLELAYADRFAAALPISAQGETALHRSMGFDHRGRVDVALNPDQPRGEWLMRYLESNRIPYFAFRAAVPHKATGAHIHVGPQSTKLTLSD